MKKSILSSWILLAFVSHASALTDDNATPKQAVVNYMNHALTSVKLPKSQILKGTRQQAGFCSLMQNDFLIADIALAVIPVSAWENASSGQRESYVRALTSHLANAAAQSFLPIADKKLEILYSEAPSIDGQEAILVKIPAVKTELTVVVRPIPNGQFRLYDVYTEGVSLIAYERGDFKRIVKKGLDALTKVLNENSDRLLGRCE